MRASLLLLALVAQHQQAAHPPRAAVAAARASWIAAHNYIVRSAEQMSEADFGFEPVATVRSFVQIVADVADDEMGWCAQILGEPLKQTQFEKTLTEPGGAVGQQQTSTVIAEYSGPSAASMKTWSPRSACSPL
jgi:hypothetical protein